MKRPKRAPRRMSDGKPADAMIMVRLRRADDGEGFYVEWGARSYEAKHGPKLDPAFLAAAGSELVNAARVERYGGVVAQAVKELQPLAAEVGKGIVQAVLSSASRR